MSILNPDLKARRIRTTRRAAALRHAIEDGRFEALLAFWDTQTSSTHPELGLDDKKLAKSRLYGEVALIAAKREYQKLLKAEFLRQAREAMKTIREQTGMDIPIQPFEED